MSALACGRVLGLFGHIAALESLVLRLLLFELLFLDLAEVHLEEHACRGHECLLDADARLRRRLEEAVQAFLAGELLTFRCGDLPVFLLVFLVRDEENQRVFLALILDVLKPARQVYERLHRRQVIRQ